MKNVFHFHRRFRRLFPSLSENSFILFVALEKVPRPFATPSDAEREAPSSSLISQRALVDVGCLRGRCFAD
jgi:hypothetical protein